MVMAVNGAQRSWYPVNYMVMPVVVASHETTPLAFALPRNSSFGVPLVSRFSPNINPIVFRHQ